MKLLIISVSSGQETSTILSERTVIILLRHLSVSLVATKTITPNYVNRFTKLGTLFRMWFRPLEKLLGNFVELEQDLDEDEGYEKREQPIRPMTP